MFYISVKHNAMLHFIFPKCIHLHTCANNCN